MIEITTEDVKRKARITTAEFDSEIDALITEMVTVIEYAIDPAHLNNQEPGLPETLNLSALEIVTGEFIAGLWREEGALVGFRLGWLQVSPPDSRGWNMNDPSGLVEQGWNRLASYLKTASRLRYQAKEPILMEENP
jgi:hypothetical protein